MTAVDDRIESEETDEDPPSRLARVREAVVNRGSSRSRNSLLTGAMAVLAVLAAWCVLYGVVLGALQEWHDQHVLYSKFRQQLAEQTAPLGGAIVPRSPVAVLDLPGLGLGSTIVVEGTASGDLVNGPGHRRDTPLPGQPGVSVIYGRTGMFAGPFRRLETLQSGSTATFVTGQGTFTYRVLDVRHVGDPYPPVLASGASRLTLVSAEGAGWRSGWAPSRLVYVDADLVGKTVPAPTGRPEAVPESELALHGDSSVLTVLVLWLSLLVAGAAVMVWAYATWGAWQTWVVGIPFVLAALWGASSAAVQLLPNLM